MKSNLLRTFFEWALVTSVLMSVGFFTWGFFKQLDYQKHVGQVQNLEAGISRNNLLMAALRAECQAYARTNTDLARFLNRPPAQPPVVPAPAPAPATKPKAK